MPVFKLSEIAARLGCQLDGDPGLEIAGLSTLEKAGPNELTFLANQKYAPKVKTTRAAAVLAQEALSNTHAATLISANPYYDFARALEFFYQPPNPPPGIHPLAFIDPSARIGPDPSIGPFAVVGANTIIGASCVLHPHAVVYPGCVIGDRLTAHSHVSIREYARIGNRVTLHNGVVVGGDGFGFARRSDGVQYKIPQSGVTVIEDDVEIQTLSSVDRATLGETRVKRGAKIDSLVQIGHACVVGEDNIICAQTGLAGSTVLEENVVMAGQTGSSGHLTIHKNAIVWGQSGVGGDVAAGATVAGSPAFDSGDWLRSVTAFPKLGELVRTLRALERRLTELEKAAASAPKP
ncbi:MAG TPA: UDP-3-O-(3-hydroxymyristoyl)glucosamine N-acyltransferase [Bryobacteraceae bacterium]|jgi:UDP-3-O-[3-hydroxymyristoyl] glucosamine N-acyltransferase|nr:UDP-3-O-(3-hydroxymyristoyl)glucosamine N-acyltransferase [Bryobacteraceae bacterium]